MSGDDVAIEKFPDDPDAFSRFTKSAILPRFDGMTKNVRLYDNTCKVAVLSRNLSKDGDGIYALIEQVINALDGYNSPSN
jgi:hypothetical protein